MKKSCFILFAAVTLGGLFLAGCGRNELPVIDSLEIANAEDTLIVAGDEVTVTCTAVDVEEDTLRYQWEVSGGEILDGQETSEIIWKSPHMSGTYDIICSVTDDETWDTLRIVSDSIQIDVQNYFPADTGYWWHYDGFIWVVNNVPHSLTRTFYSREDLAGAEVRWHVESKDSNSAWGEGGGVIDSTDFYSVNDGEVLESVHCWLWRLLHFEGVICQMPLWKGKMWVYSDSGVATVVEIIDRGTEAFSFQDCAHIEITTTGDTVNVRTIWLAPDVGIIAERLERDGSEMVDFELMDYGPR